jgi:hypothetical protein
MYGPKESSSKGALSKNKHLVTHGLRTDEIDIVLMTSNLLDNRLNVPKA